MERKFKIYKELQHFNVGPFKVKQPLPNSEVDGLSPFILLHHAGPTHHAPGEIKALLSPHPHRGFEPVTFLFNGSLHHKDSTGSEGFLQTGDVQWMTSGKGIIHSEGPSEDFAKKGGLMELVQLWINLPRENKLTEPKYQDIKSEQIPVVEENGFRTKVVAGEYRGKKGPAQTFIPIHAYMVEFEKNGKAVYEIPADHNLMVYVLEGTVVSTGTEINSLEMAVFEKSGEPLTLESKTSGKLLLLAGEPINEPVVSYGPFVMNYPGEIKQAIMDYEMGKMGELEG